MERAEVARRIHGVAAVLDRLSERMAANEPMEARHLDLAIAQLKGLRVQAFGRGGRGPGSARERILNHLIENVGEVIPGEELGEVAGISAWARRIRELRADGLSISQPEVGMYRLDELP